MNVVLFAADSRCFQYLLPVARVLNDRGHNYLFMANQTTPLIHPLKENLHHFQFYSNVENSDEYGITSDTLNINLPFKPDVVILARENWNPEQSIIREFKERFNSTVCLVEVNTHLINVIEAKMEMLSRNKYPQNMIDVFFDQHQERKLFEVMV